MKTPRITFLHVLALVSSAAGASPITVDPNAFATGTDLSNATSGVTLSSMWRTGPGGVFDPNAPLTDFNLSPIFATECNSSSAYHCDTIAGDKLFGHNPDIWTSTAHAFENNAASYLKGELFNTNAIFSVFRADFAGGTDFAEVTIGGAHNADFPRVDFWDLAGGYLGTCSTPLAFGEVMAPGCTVTFVGDGSTSSPDFAEPWLISLTSSDANIGFLTAGGWAGGQFVSGLTFNSVPEPGTLGLLALGALGLVLTQRRETRAASRGECAS
jgi:hypothetical protein